MIIIYDVVDKIKHLQKLDENSLKLKSPSKKHKRIHHWPAGALFFFTQHDFRIWHSKFKTRMR